MTDDAQSFTDAELRVLVEDYVRPPKVARRVGADFVDIKHCHGYLLHEFLSARTRPGPYGGSLENRTRMLREIVAGIRAEAPDLLIGVRVSAFDFVPFRPAWRQRRRQARARPSPRTTRTLLPYRYAFGANPESPTEPDLTEPIAVPRDAASIGHSSW